jgi:hypothetical protein
MEAVTLYSEQPETAKSIVAKFPSESAVSVRESQIAFSDPKAACSIAYIRSNFGWFPESIKRLKTQRLPLQEFTDTTKNASGKLSAGKGEVGESVSIKLKAVLKRNPGS